MTHYSNCIDCKWYIPYQPFHSDCGGEKVDTQVASNGGVFPANCSKCSSKFYVMGYGCDLKEVVDENEKL